MTHIEAMKQGLEALELVSTEFVCNGAHHAKKDRHGLGEPCPIVERYEEAIASLRQAIAEAEKQEPVIDKSAAIRIATALGWEPKRTWVGLTDEDIDEWTPEIHVVIKAIEARLKQKNT